MSQSISSASPISALSADRAKKTLCLCASAFNPEKMKVNTILETCLYASDLEAVEKFYSKVLGLQPFSEREGRSVFFRCGPQVLLFFNPESTSKIPVDVDGALIPMHGTTGEGHVCFSVKESEIDDWKKWLTEQGVPIESEVTWGSGTRSVYFRDPAGNCLEVASPKLWDLPEPG